MDGRGGTRLMQRVKYSYSDPKARNLTRELEDSIKEIDDDVYIIVETSGKYPSRLIYFMNKGLINKVRFIIKKEEDQRIVTSCRIKSCMIAHNCDKIEDEIILHTENQIEIDKYTDMFGEENIKIRRK